MFGSVFWLTKKSVWNAVLTCWSDVMLPAGILRSLTFELAVKPAVHAGRGWWRVGGARGCAPVCAPAPASAAATFAPENTVAGVARAAAAGAPAGAPAGAAGPNLVFFGLAPGAAAPVREPDG